MNDIEDKDQEGNEEQDAGFELDKIDIGDILSDAKPEPAKKAPAEAEEAAPRPKPPVRPDAPKKKQPVAVYVIVAFVVVAIASLFFWGRGQLSINLSPQAATEQPKKAPYVTVGPVVSIVGNAGHLKMTMEITCRTPAQQKRVDAMHNDIRGWVMDIIQTPGVEKMLIEKNYDGMREHLKVKINEILGENAVKEIYFSEIIVY